MRIWCLTSAWPTPRSASLKRACPCTSFRPHWAWSTHYTMFTSNSSIHTRLLKIKVLGSEKIYQKWNSTLFLQHSILKRRDWTMRWRSSCPMFSIISWRQIPRTKISSFSKDLARWENLHRVLLTCFSKSSKWKESSIWWATFCLSTWQV